MALRWVFPMLLTALLAAQEQDETDTYFPKVPQETGKKCSLLIP